MKKIKVFCLADSPLAPSGVGTQTRYMIEGLLQTGRFQFVCFGGAIRHPDYKPIRTEEYGDDWLIYPVDGYGSQEQVRALLKAQKPDIVWIMTDPRFWGWLWEIDNEIRSVAPLVYYHVWDNLPYPTFNRKWYLSNDLVASISKVTDDIVRNVAPEVELVRIPHAVNDSVFSRIEDRDLIKNFKKENSIGVDSKGNKRFTFFWNNRNARRKQSGSLMFWFNDFLNKVGRDKATLIMHTEPKDPNGQDLIAIKERLKLDDDQFKLSTTKLSMEQLSVLYNSCDCTVNISDAEGFGLATLESLATETPIIVNMTGGLQEQVTDGKEWFGIGIEPSSKSVIGSQEVPWIYEDRIDSSDLVNAMVEMFEKTEEERRVLGKKGRDHVLKNYSMSNYVSLWDKTLTKIHEDYGSWENKKSNLWSLSKVL
jgi:glycosyltransferase involved in cell wall biosynthesis